MNAWEIWTWSDHLAVVVSHPDRAARKETVEVLACSTNRAGRALKAHEILLDAADGLDWGTLCYCDLVYAVPRAELRAMRGIVSRERRRAIVQTILQSHGWIGL